MKLIFTKFSSAEKVPEITKVPDSPPSSPRSANGELDEDTLAQNRMRLAQKLGSPNAKKKTAEKQYVLHFRTTRLNY